MEPTTTTEAAEEPGERGGWGRRPPPQTIIAAVVALAIGLAGGFLIGWKVEQSRVKSDVKELKERLRAAAQPEDGNADTAQVTRRVGEVTAVAPDSVTITDRSGRDRVIKLSGSTAIHKAKLGARADLANGATILFSAEQATKDGAAAKEVIVLPASTAFNGYRVSEVTPESLSATNSDDTSTIALADTTVVYKTTTGAAADIIQGARIVVRDDAASGADEVVVLPAGSTFIA
jgi:hypothetical protein